MGFADTSHVGVWTLRASYQSFQKASFKEYTLNLIMDPYIV